MNVKSQSLDEEDLKIVAAEQITNHIHIEPTKEASPKYILGTLLIRIAGARNLPAVSFENVSRIVRLLSSAKGTSNPYCNVCFDDQSQRTSQLFGTLDPSWPRGEEMCFDVVLGVNNLALEEECAFSYFDGDEKLPTLVTLEVMHSDGGGKGKVQKGGKLNSNKNGNNDNDNFISPLGSVSIDVNDLLTGKAQRFDDWETLDSGGEVNIIAEYMPTDDKPAIGDMCRLTSFCSRKDLYPIPVHLLFCVDGLDGDFVVLSYTTDVGWVSTFQVHRFTVISAIRHQAAIEQYQEQLLEIAQKLVVSPAAEAVADVFARIPDDGLVQVGAEIMNHGGALLQRWLKGGLQTVVSDVKFASNWEGEKKFEGEDEGEDEGGSGGDREGEGEANDEGEGDDLDLEYQNKEATPGMPCCPITGVPMIIPVVASDGHTYEKRAILKWFSQSSMSPLTGTVITNKHVVSNFSLVNTVQSE